MKLYNVKLQKQAEKNFDMASTLILLFVRVCVYVFIC